MDVLIVDDEPLARARLARLVEQIGGYRVVGQAGSGEEALALLAGAAPDVVLLDVQMPGLGGLETARRLARLEAPPAIVFCTAHEQHALDAFDVNAVGYLLKPVRRDRLAATLEQAARVNRGRELETDRSYVVARTHRGIERIPVAEIRYFQADQKYTRVCHTGGEVLIEDTLRELEASLGGLVVRVHRATLVAVRYLERLEREPSGRWVVGLRGVNETLEVSRRHLAEVRRALKL